jgi:outer membrane protein assembly factor BamB
MCIIRKSLAILISSAALTAGAQAQEWWPTYRHDSQRTGVQPTASALSDPAKVKTLHVKWVSELRGTGKVLPMFQASPIVINDTVFIGSTGGYFYALDATSGGFKWQYPPLGDPPLLGSCSAFGGYGIQSSATYAKIGGQDPAGPQDAIIFGAPDPTAETGLGSARLFALSLSGNLIWKSDVVAHVSGCTSFATSELHERVGHSSPLVLGDRVYVGVHDSGDNPIQQGRVSVVDLSSGTLVTGFSYASTGKLGDGTRGGGIWNSLAADTAGGVYFTTGNTRIPPCNHPYTGPGCAAPSFHDPSPNYGLSMIRVDKTTGNIAWHFNAVDFAHDGDPDWAAGAAVMPKSCGKVELIASVQKDGWSYALNASNGNMQWQFPNTGLGTAFLNDVHGDDGYWVPGAAWNDEFIVKTGGESLVHDGVKPGYSRLHALDACATTEKDRVMAGRASARGRADAGWYRPRLLVPDALFRDLWSQA